MRDAKKVFVCAGMITAAFACKPPASSSAKAIVGTEDGANHAFSLMPVVNIVSDRALQVETTSPGADYAKHVLDHQFFAIIDCGDVTVTDASGRKIEVKADIEMKTLELDAALGLFGVDADRKLWRKSQSGKFDEPVPCRVEGAHLYPIPVVNQALDAAYKGGGDDDFKLTQTVYLSLRGNTTTTGHSISALFHAWVTANNLFYNLGEITQDQLLAIMEEKDKDLNPAIDAQGKFGAKKLSNYEKAPVPESPAFNYKAKGAFADVKAAREFLRDRLDERFLKMYPATAAASSYGAALWNKLSSTTAWSSGSGKAREVGDYLAGRGDFAFDARLKGDEYKLDFGAVSGPSAGAGLNLVDGEVRLRGTVTGVNCQVQCQPLIPSPSGTYGVNGRGRGNGRRTATAVGTATGTTGTGGRINGGTVLSQQQAAQAIAGRITQNTSAGAATGVVAQAHQQMLQSQNQNLQQVQQAIQSGQLRTTGQVIGGMTQFTGNVGGTSNATVYVGPQGQTQTWIPEQVPSGVQTSGGTIPQGSTVNYMRELGDPFRNAGTGGTTGGTTSGTPPVGTTGGRGTNPMGDTNAGFAQIQAPNGDRQIAVGFSGDGKGVDLIPATTNAAGQLVVNCNAPGTQQALTTAGNDYRLAQQNLSQQFQQTSDQSTRLAIAKEYERNQNVFTQLRTAAGGCAGSLGATAGSLGLRGYSLEGEGGCDSTGGADNTGTADTNPGTDTTGGTDNTDNPGGADTTGTNTTGGADQTDLSGSGTTDMSGSGTTDMSGSGTTDMSGSGTTDMSGSGTTDMSGSGTTDMSGGGSTDVSSDLPPE